MHCMKSVCIQSYSGPYFPAFGLDTEKYFLSICIQSECGKIRTTITPNTDTFFALMKAFIKGLEQEVLRLIYVAEKLQTRITASSSLCYIKKIWVIVKTLPWHMPIFYSTT